MKSAWPLTALGMLLGTVAIISFSAGLAVAGVLWRARAMYAEDRELLRRDAVGHLDTCVDSLAEARAKCEPPLAPVRWEGR